MGLGGKVGEKALQVASIAFLEAGAAWRRACRAALCRTTRQTRAATAIIT
jgi:hypothetical protein